MLNEDLEDLCRDIVGAPRREGSHDRGWSDVRRSFRERDGSYWTAAFRNLPSLGMFTQRVQSCSGLGFRDVCSPGGVNIVIQREAVLVSDVNGGEQVSISD